MSQPISSRSRLAEALSGWPPPVLDPQGPFSNTVTTLAWVLIALVTLIFALVCAALWVALYGSDELRARLGGEGVVKWFGMIVPAGVLFLLLAWGTTMVAGMSDDQGRRVAHARIRQPLLVARVLPGRGGQRSMPMPTSCTSRSAARWSSTWCRRT
jgi:uncharacterized membrane protein